MPNFTMWVGDRKQEIYWWSKATINIWFVSHPHVQQEQRWTGGDTDYLLCQCAKAKCTCVYTNKIIFQMHFIITVMVEITFLPKNASGCDF